MSEDLSPAPGRPDLTVPPAVVSWLQDLLRLADGAVVAAVGAPAWATAGAGTAGCRTVEVATTGSGPVVWRPRYARVVAAGGRLPLRTASLDAVLVGAFVRPDAAAAVVDEAARALRTGGRVGVVRHTADTSVGWVGRVVAILAGAVGGTVGRERDASVVDALTGGRGLGPVAATMIRYHRECGVDEAVDRFVAASRVGLLPPDQQGVAVDSARDVLLTHPATRARRSLVVPYRVDGHWCERLPR